MNTQLDVLRNDRLRLRDRSLLLVAFICLGLAAVYQFVGFRSLLFGSGETVPVDFRLRWVESHLLLEGKDSHTWGHPDPELPPRLRWQRNLGGGYPPWATAYGLLLAPPTPWLLARSWFAFLNAAALAVISRWAYSTGIKYSLSFAVFLVAASLACASAAICVSYGQYAVLITAALVIAAVACERNRKVAAGFALGFCLVKPQLAAMAVVAALIRREFLAVAIAGAVVVVGCGVMWAMSGIDPVTALLDSQRDAKAFSSISVNPLTAWLLPVWGFERTTLLLGLSFLVAGSAIAFLSPPQVRMSVLFAIAVIVSMFWSYRRGYDCPLLIIPMVLLFEAAIARGSTALWVMAFAFGISLWLPVRNEQWTWVSVQVVHLLVWVAGGIALLLSEVNCNPSAARDQSHIPLSEALA